ncbi:MAG TPA: hypothetical protein VMV31_06045 [Terriglobales bacterium]|nr:hypothetical protein [Terriglobales bacterium]
MSMTLGCPRCNSQDIRRVRRTWWDHLLRRRRVYRCDGCQHRFAPAGD